MGRRIRLSSTAATYHVMARGNDRTSIYLDDDDRHRFLDLLGRVVVRRRWNCASFCLMGNHFHLLLSTLEGGLSEGMRDLLGTHARAFNARHGRSGHLFRERFLSVRITDERQYSAVIRYIARNPVEAGLVEKAADWQWSSTGAILGIAPVPPWLDATSPLAASASQASDARRAFLELIDGELDDNHRVEDDSIPIPTPPRPAPLPAAEVLRLRGAEEGLLACVALGYSHEEIAGVLGLTRSAVSQRVRVLRRR